MHFMNVSRCVATHLTAIGLIATASSAGNLAFAETIFTVNGIDVDSAVVDLYFENRLGQPGSTPTPELLIKDQSHLHAGHEGAKDGKGHFDVTIVSEAFSGVNRVQRHRMVYDALGKLLETDIHALRIKAFAPSER